MRWSKRMSSRNWRRADVPKEISGHSLLACRCICGTPFHGEPGGSDEELQDRGPDTMFAAIGHMGQYVMVSPEQKLTVVRLGHSMPEDRKRMLQELLDVVELYPET